MELNRLQTQLARQIVEWLNETRPEPGTKVAAAELARRFEVSRSPVRTALQWLADRNVLQPESGRGFLVSTLPVDLSALGLEAASDSQQQLYEQLVRDLVQAQLADECSEAELMKHYGVERNLLLNVLQQLDREGVAQRKAGRGWQFKAVLNSRQAFAESYEFRKQLEPMAISSPGFRWSIEKAAPIRARQQALLDQGSADPGEIFAANAEFHEFIASCANNRFLLQAVQQQNLLRRFVEYQYRWGERPNAVTKSCADHLAILDALDAGQFERASRLLWLHLDRTSNIKDDSTRIDTENWQEV